MPNRSREYDLAVVGAGVIGLSAAWRAAQRGLRVVVLERDQPAQAATHAAAGMLAPVSEALATEQALLALGLASAQRYPQFVADLQDASGVDTGYLGCGTLLVARDADEAEALGREQALRERLGLSVARLRASEARRLEPALAPTLRLALEIADDHAIDPRRLALALTRALEGAGGQLRTGVTVVGLIEQDGRIAGVRLHTEEAVTAENVLIATGAWTVDGIPERARVPLRPVKGQIMRLHDPAGPGLLTRVLRMRAGYIVPRGDGRYVLGATMEERGFDTTVTAGALYELLRDATELVPGVAELVLDEFGAGLRPAAPDNLPVIGPGAIPGLHWAVGHYRHGILLAPLTADAVADQLAGEAPGPDLAACTPDRFVHAGARA